MAKFRLNFDKPLIDQNVNQPVGAYSYLEPSADRLNSGIAG